MQCSEGSRDKSTGVGPTRRRGPVPRDTLAPPWPRTSLTSSPDWESRGGRSEGFVRTLSAPPLGVISLPSRPSLGSFRLKTPPRVLVKSSLRAPRTSHSRNDRPYPSSLCHGSRFDSDQTKIFLHVLESPPGDFFLFLSSYLSNYEWGSPSTE